MPEGCSFSLGGESSTVNLMVDEMVQWMALALPFVYLVMVAQFQSLLSPFIVLFTVPLAFTGGLLGMLVTGQQLTMISLMGFIVLMGASQITIDRIVLAVDENMDTTQCRGEGGTEGGL